MEQTLVMLKPNAARLKLIGEVISRFEKARLSLVRMEMKTLTLETAREFYKEHAGKPFYEPLIGFMTSGAIVAMVVEGDNAIAAVRAIAGATNPAEALPGTIRYDFAPNTRENIIHASDSTQSAAREIRFHFPE
ncbi:MAG: nucleoside-diphosphate kinase [Fibrobacterota bacterium]